MFCENCGAKMPDNAKFCTECGTKVSPVVEETKPVVEEPKVEKIKIEETKSEAVEGLAAAGATVVGASAAEEPEQKSAKELLEEKLGKKLEAESSEPKPEAVTEASSQGSAKEDILKFAEKKEAPKAKETAAPVVVPPVGGGSEQAKPQAQSKGFIQDYFDDLKSFNFNGRLNRLKYWKYILMNMVVMFVINKVLNIIGAGASLANAVSLVMSILFLPFSVRRLHDLNRNGLFMLLVFVPIVNFFFGIYVGFFKGTEGPNQYGDDPLAGA